MYIKRCEKVTNNVIHITSINLLTVAILNV